MKKIKADALVRKLVTNKITREEFDELLFGLEDEHMVFYLEVSLKNHFDSVMKEHASKIVHPGKIPKSD